MITNEKVQYRNLGRTGVKVSPLCLGTMNFGVRTPEAEAAEIINHYIEAGHNFIDTANVYGRFNGRGEVGWSEEIIGNTLSANGKRGRIILATKVWGHMDPEDPNARGLSRKHILTSCKDSLKRLKTKYIDLYQLHRPVLDIPIDETLRVLDDLIRRGWVRYIGTSMFPTWRIMEGLWVSEKYHLNRFVSEQPRYNIYDREIEREIVPMAQKYNLAILPFSPLGGGILTGKYRKGESFPEDSRLTFDELASYYVNALNKKFYELLDILKEISNDKGCTISQLSLAWVITHPGITSVIIGPRTMEQLEDNLDALNVTLTEKDYQRIDGMTIPGSNIENF